MAAAILTDIQRFAVKGLSSDKLTSVELLARAGLPHDRRFACVFLRSAHLLKENEWLHKENFLSVFASGSVVSEYESAFDDDTCELRVWRRGKREEETPLLCALLDTPAGREAASNFFSEAVGERVELVDGRDTHQFGNTSKGLKASGDLRTLHIVNANTVRALATAAGVPIDPRRFRPNLILDGLAAWEEFTWVGREIRIGGAATLTVLDRTVRCEGVHRSAEVGDVATLGAARAAEASAACDAGAHLDVVKLLNTHFPQHGPYLGVCIAARAPNRDPCRVARSDRPWCVGLGRRAGQTRRSATTEPSASAIALSFGRRRTRVRGGRRCCWRRPPSCWRWSCG
jgi:uncharacterized protein YcbX